MLLKNRLQDCFYVFIRIIWGLILSGAVPKPPNPALLAEFNSRFRDISNINGVAESTTAQPLIELREVFTLAQARGGRLKVGKGIVMIHEFFLEWALAMLAKLGIREWGPDLEAAIDSLWNEACRISAIRIFRQWVIGNAFVYMNIDKVLASDILLLERTYNHYVHFYMASKFKVEQKKEGKNKENDERKVQQRNRQRVSVMWP